MCIWGIEWRLQIKRSIFSLYGISKLVSHELHKIPDIVYIDIKQYY